MVHGLLQDRQQEFFIQRANKQHSEAQQDGSAPEPAGIAWDAQDAYDAAEWHSGFQVGVPPNAAFLLE